MGVPWYDFGLRHERLHSYPHRINTTTIRKLCLGAFGHTCRLQPGTQAIDIVASTPLSSWRRPRERPPLDVPEFKQVSYPMTAGSRPGWQEPKRVESILIMDYFLQLGLCLGWYGLISSLVMSMMISGGLVVCPAEIVSATSSHPPVRPCAVRK